MEKTDDLEHGQHIKDQTDLGPMHNQRGICCLGAYKKS